MKVRTINRVLRALGLVLVVSYGDDEPTRLWIERWSTYQARCAKRPWVAPPSTPETNTLHRIERSASVLNSYGEHVGDACPVCRGARAEIDGDFVRPPVEVGHRPGCELAAAIGKGTR